ncbi:MAG: hypothetical protein ACR2PA_25275 [Hyphomicrobiaceae bacterium]
MTKPVQRWTGLLALSMIVLASIGSQVAADENQAFLSSMAGSWRSRGIAQDSVSAKSVAILCALNSQLSANGSKLNNTGECASTNGTTPVRGELAYDPASRQLSGTLINVEERNFRTNGVGSVKDNLLTMRVSVRNDEGRLTGQGSLTIRRLSPRKMSMKLIVKDLPTGKVFTAMRLTMNKR